MVVVVQLTVLPKLTTETAKSGRNIANDSAGSLRCRPLPAGVADISCRGRTGAAGAPKPDFAAASGKVILRNITTPINPIVRTRPAAMPYSLAKIGRLVGFPLPKLPVRNVKSKIVWEGRHKRDSLIFRLFFPPPAPSDRSPNGSMVPGC